MLVCNASPLANEIIRVMHEVDLVKFNLQFFLLQLSCRRMKKIQLDDA